MDMNSRVEMVGVEKTKLDALKTWYSLFTVLIDNPPDELGGENGLLTKLHKLREEMRKYTGV